MSKVSRNKILEPYFAGPEIHGVRYFDKLPLKQLEELIKSDFVEMEAWNSCPGVADAFLPFMKRHPAFTAHGYAVSFKRQDTRITIEGLEKTEPLTNSEIIDFANSFTNADEVHFTKTYAYCWYD